jgi:hypothetical protein
VQQIAQLKSSAARRDKISLKLAELVDEWAVDTSVDVTPQETFSPSCRDHSLLRGRS